LVATGDAGAPPILLGGIAVALEGAAAPQRGGPGSGATTIALGGARLVAVAQGRALEELALRPRLARHIDAPERAQPSAGLLPQGVAEEAEGALEHQLARSVDLTRCEIEGPARLVGVQLGDLVEDRQGIAALLQVVECRGSLMLVAGLGHRREVRGDRQ